MVFRYICRTRFNIRSGLAESRKNCKMEETHFDCSPVQEDERLFVAFVTKWFRRRYYVSRSIEAFNTVKIQSVGKI